MANLLLTVFWLSKYLNEQYVQPNSCYDTVVCGQIANYQWLLFKGCAYAYLLVDWLSIQGIMIVLFAEELSLWNADAREC